MSSYSHHLALMSSSREQEKLCIFSSFPQYLLRIIFTCSKLLNKNDTLLKISMLAHILYRKEPNILTETALIFRVEGMKV